MDKAHAGGAVEIYCDAWGVSIFRTALTVLRNTSLLPRSSGSTNFDPSSHLVRTFGFSGTGVFSSSVVFLCQASGTRRFRVGVRSLPPKFSHCYTRTVRLRGTRRRKCRFDYWKPRLEEHVIRDKTRLEELDELGWQTLVVWQCELDDMEALASRLQDFVGER